MVVVAHIRKRSWLTCILLTTIVSAKAIILTKKDPITIISHGHSISGFPFFKVTSLSPSTTTTTSSSSTSPAPNGVQIEVKYSELYDGLSAKNSDGPYMFSSGLSNNFRVETFNLSQVGVGLTEGWLYQAGVVHQSLRLINGDEVIFDDVGLRDYQDDRRPKSHPGTFTSSNTLYNQIWSLGPHSINSACVRSNTQRSTWEPVSGKGVLVRGQRAARSVTLSRFLPESYTIRFETMIGRAGTGWVVDTALGGAGVWMFLTSNLPTETTFVNHDHELLPRNSLILGTGFGLVSEIYNGGHKFAQFDTGLEILESTWYNLTLIVKSRRHYTLYLNDHHLILPTLNTEDYGVPAFHPFFGNATIGFGPWQDMSAFYRNVVVEDERGVIIYENDMEGGEEVLAEFGVAGNEYDVCLDGASRDRLIWTGDFYTAHNTLLVSSYELEFTRGTMNFAFDYRLESGAVPTSNPMGIRRGDRDAWSAAPSTLYTDYHLDLLNIVHEYYLATGDLVYVKTRWSDIKALLSYILTFLDPTTHLLNTMIFKGSSEGTSPGCMLTYCLKNLALLADLLEDGDAAVEYRELAKKTEDAVRGLWDEDKGTFWTSSSYDAFAYIDLAWTILSGIATPEQIASQLKHLKKLRYTIGYLGDSNAVGSDSTVLAPYFSGYLIEALFRVEAEEEAQFLLDGIFGAMAKPSKDFSGSSWEYVSPHGAPGDGLFTSLNHPWGSGATPALSRHVLGITPLSPGYTSWSVSPKLLSLNWAKGAVPTPLGKIEVEWEIKEDTDKFELGVTAPVGTTGWVVPPRQRRGSKWLVGGVKVEKGTGFWVSGGETVWVVEM
ncbi:Six-hairpin glycosidase [Meredithblackwellia eburnea MCA 4105]